MTKQLTVYGGMLALWTIGSGPAVAFEETTVAPEPSLAAQEQTNEALTLDMQLPGAAGSEGDTLKLQNSGSLKVMPQLDFGLELLYSSKEDDDSIAHAAPELDETDEFKILGTIKRRF